MLHLPNDKNPDGSYSTGYVLERNQIDVSLDTLSDCLEIKPNENYWAEIVGLEKVDLNQINGFPEDLIIPVKRLRTRYWVPKQFYHDFEDRFSLVDIPKKHFDNLLYIVHYHEHYFLKHMFRSSETEHVAAIKQMLGFVEIIQIDRFHPTKLTFQGALFDGLVPKENEVPEEYSFSIKQPDVLRHLLVDFRHWTKSHQYKAMFTKYENVLDSARKDLKVKQDARYSVFRWLDRYLREYKVARSTNDRHMKIGILLSIYPDLITFNPLIEQEEVDEKKRIQRTKAEAARLVGKILQRNS
jgi:hypothetical protein